MSGVSLLMSIFLSFIRPRKAFEFGLNRVIKKLFKYSRGSYSFTSGRGGIGALLKSLNQGEEDSEVIISAFTCLAVPTGIISAGFKPIYVDCDLNDINASVDAIIRSITDKTKVIIVQHTMGLATDVVLLKEKIKGSGILIFEDCALALGTTIDNVILGSFGDATIISLELSKFITTGWGGIIVINNEILDERFRVFYDNVSVQSRYSSFKTAFQTLLSGISYNYFIYHLFGKYILYFGYKWKIFNISTPEDQLKGKVAENFIEKLGNIQLCYAKFQFKRFTDYAVVTNYNYERIRSELIRHGYFVFTPSMSNSFAVSPRIPLLVNDPKKAIDFFSLYGIEIGVWFDGPLTPTPDSNFFRYEKYKYPNANFISSRVINFPCHSGIGKRDLDIIIASIVDFKMQNPESIIIYP
jgi:perosamine synthetase